MTTRRTIEAVLLVAAGAVLAFVLLQADGANGEAPSGDAADGEKDNSAPSRDDASRPTPRPAVPDLELDAETPRLSGPEARPGEAPRVRESRLRAVRAYEDFFRRAELTKDQIAKTLRVFADAQIEMDEYLKIRREFDRGERKQAVETGTERREALQASARARLAEFLSEEQLEVFDADIPLATLAALQPLDL